VPENIAGSAAQGKWLISKGGGNQPRWRGDGKELYFQAPTLQLFAAGIRTGNTFAAEALRPLFSLPLLNAGDVTADGKRFLYPAPEGANAPSPFTVVTNWQAALKR